MERVEDLLMILKQPRSPVAEAYRGVRTSLQRALANNVKTIMFVSSFGGDGKSMVCANVAVALSQLFLDVVLVDADLRRPTLTNLFELVDVPGLGDFLAGTATLEQSLSPTSIDRLKMVPAGLVTENPGDLLGRPALATFCRSIAEKADVVIIDTSPIAACNDALSIGQHIDTTLMVISPRRWDGGVEVRIRQTLEQHKVPLMGVVLNGSVPGEGGSYGYGYGYGYGGYGYGGYGSKNRSTTSYGYYGDEAPQEGRHQRGFWSRVKGLFGPER